MDNFDAHKWFKKQYLAEDKDKEKEEKELRDYYKGDSDVFPSSLKEDDIEEGHGLEIDDLEQLKTYTNNLPEDTLSDKAIKRILNFLIKSNIKVDKTKDLSKSSSLIGRMGDRSLKENMSPGEAIVELNYYMDELQNISGEVKQIMRQTFPDEYTRGDAYGAFDFGTSGNRYDTTFEGILDDLASVGDGMEDYE